MSIGDLIVCPATHAVKTYIDGVGTWTRGTDNVWFQYVQGNGGKKYRFRCLLCGRKSGDVPHDLIKHHTQWHQRMDGYRWHMRGAA